MWPIRPRRAVGSGPAPRTPRTAGALRPPQPVPGGPARGTRPRTRPAAAPAPARRVLSRARRGQPPGRSPGPCSSRARRSRPAVGAGGRQRRAAGRAEQPHQPAPSCDGRARSRRRERRRLLAILPTPPPSSSSPCAGAAAARARGAAGAGERRAEPRGERGRLGPNSEFRRAGTGPGSGAGSEPARPLAVWARCGAEPAAAPGTGGLRALLLGQTCLGTARRPLKCIAVVRKCSEAWS